MRLRREFRSGIESCHHVNAARSVRSSWGTGTTPLSARVNPVDYLAWTPRELTRGIKRCLVNVEPSEPHPLRSLDLMFIAGDHRDPLAPVHQPGGTAENDVV